MTVAAHVANGNTAVRHRPELTLLYQVIEHHLPKFAEHLREQDRIVQKFILQEFDYYLKCG